MVDRRSALGVPLVAAAVAALLVALAYLTFGTRWGNEAYLLSYLLYAAYVPVAGALATRRYRLFASALLVAVGAHLFGGGLVVSPRCLGGPGGAGAWAFRYRVRRGVIEYEAGQPPCRVEPDPLLVPLGYLVVTVGCLQLADDLLPGGLLPVDLYSLLRLR